MSAPDRFRDDVGAYLLGALEPSEHDAFEDHLSGCEACREEVEWLSLARDALPRSVEQMAPPRSLRASLMETVRAEAARDAAPEPRRSRWRETFLARPAFAAAAAAMLLAVGIGAGVLVGAPGGGDDGSRTVAAVVDQTRMPSGTASLVVPDDGEAGAQLRVEGMQPPPEGKVYEVWIKRGTRVTPSSLFTVDTGGSGTAAIPEDVHDADAVMVTREREGGAKTPSEPPVMTVSLPS